MAAAAAELFDTANLVQLPKTAWQRFRTLPAWQQAGIAAAVAYASGILTGAVIDEGFAKGKLQAWAKRSAGPDGPAPLEPELEQVRDFAVIGALSGDCARDPSAPGCSSVRAAQRRIQRTEEYGLGDATRAEVKRAQAIREKRMAIERTTVDTLGGIDRHGRAHRPPRMANQSGDQGSGFHVAHGRRIARSDQQVRSLAIGRAKRFAKARTELEEQGGVRKSLQKRFYND